jgi:hypothetical protein
LLAGLRARRAEAIGGTGSVAAGAAGPGRLDVEVTRSWGSDPGLNAKHAWERWATRQAAELERVRQVQRQAPAEAAALEAGQRLDEPAPAPAEAAEAAPQQRHYQQPAIPAVPLPPSRPGRPTVLAVDPPASSGLTATALETLAADAVQRAWELAHGERSTGLELGTGADIARRAANMLGHGDPHGDSRGEGDLAALARAAGVPPRQLLRQALAWRDGGPEGFAVLLEDWDPPRDSVVSGRALLGSDATIRRNRVTLDDRQLRLGRDGRWYPYRRAGLRGTTWDPDGSPQEPEQALFREGWS